MPDRANQEHAHGREPDPHGEGQFARATLLGSELTFQPLAVVTVLVSFVRSAGPNPLDVLAKRFVNLAECLDLLGLCRALSVKFNPCRPNLVAARLHVRKLAHEHLDDSFRVRSLLATLKILLL